MLPRNAVWGGMMQETGMLLSDARKLCGMELLRVFRMGVVQYHKGICKVIFLP